MLFEKKFHKKIIKGFKGGFPLLLIYIGVPVLTVILIYFLDK